MPRNRSQKPTGIVASGVTLAGLNRNKPPKRIETEVWQNAAWAFYDTIGEYRYACGWVGNLLSRVKITVLKDGALTTDQVALDALAQLFGGPDGQREMMRLLGIHFTVAGDAYIVAEDQGEEVGDKWLVVAASEMKWTGTEWMVGKKKLDDPLVVRTWKQHPRKHKASDSPTRAVLPILSEIDGLTKHVAAQIDSRLAGAGMLVLPSEISFASASTSTDDQKVISNPGASAQEFLKVLGENMMTPIENRESASAVVPMILQAAGEHLDKIQHLTFWTELDENSIALRKEAIGRLGLGMDMPPEALTGVGDMNHWGAWQVEESQIKAHTEPLIDIILSALTEGYLRPYLEAEDMDEEEAALYQFGADTSALRIRPNRSKEAIELYQMGELSAEAMRRENGFDEDDAPSDEERIGFLTRRVASGSTTPELVAAALEVLGVALSPVQATIVEDGPDATEARPQPSIAQHPTRELPERTEENSLINQAVFASQFHVLRALERAGNRMKTRHATLPEGVQAVDAYMFYPQVDRKQAASLLADAWGYVDRVDCGLPPAFLARELHMFTSALIAERKRFSSEELREHITAAARSEGLCA